MENVNVLIVEDDEITATNLSLSLGRHGYNVVAICESAIETKNKIKTCSVDIILVDISLQDGNDGIELAKEIKTKYNIPFIYLTSYSSDEIISQAKETEPYGYIVKPFDPNSLHATIQMALFKYKIEGERKNDINSLQVDKLNLEKLLYSKKLSDKPIVPFGEDYYFDIGLSETFYKGKKIKLTKKENAFFKTSCCSNGCCCEL